MIRKYSLILFLMLIFIFGWQLFAMAQQELKLQYQNRGNRHEGIKPKPVSGYD